MDYYKRQPARGTENREKVRRRWEWSKRLGTRNGPDKVHAVANGASFERAHEVRQDGGWSWTHAGLRGVGATL